MYAFVVIEEATMNNFVRWMYMKSLSGNRLRFCISEVLSLII